jgi:hypothetical protein
MLKQILLERNLAFCSDRESGDNLPLAYEW